MFCCIGNLIAIVVCPKHCIVFGRIETHANIVRVYASFVSQYYVCVHVYRILGIFSALV